MSDTIKLQGISERKQGTQAKDLKVGDVLLWNFGYKSEVVEIVPTKSGKSFNVSCKSFQDGIIRDRRLSGTREVVVCN